MSILPVRLDGIISDCGNCNQFGIGDLDESTFRAVPLANRAGTIAAQITLRVIAHVAIVPRDAHETTALDMIYFGWKYCRHATSELHETVTDRAHKADLGAIDQIGPWRNLRPIDQDCSSDRKKLSLLHQ